MPDPIDIAYIREVWDLELAQVMMSAVLQYNMLVFSTLHTTNTAETFIRLLNMGVEPWVLAESIVLVQAQRLLHKLCSECKEEAKVPPEVLVEAGLPNDLATSATVYKRAGCSACYDIGYRGYVMACETMPQRKGLGKELLAPSSEDVKRVSIESGMRTLRMSALAKMCEGLTSLEEVLLVTPPDNVSG